MGWKIHWFTTTDDFSEDSHVPEYFGLNVFLRHGKEVFRTYISSVRGDRTGLELPRPRLVGSRLGGFYPQDPPYSWERLDDEYDDASKDVR
jgi:hypothetical protein